MCEVSWLFLLSAGHYRFRPVTADPPSGPAGRYARHRATVRWRGEVVDMRRVGVILALGVLLSMRPGGLDRCRLPVGSSGAERSGTVHSIQQAPCAGHVVGGLAGQAELPLFQADGHAHHANDSGDSSRGEQADGNERDQGGHGEPPFFGWLLAAAVWLWMTHRRVDAL